MAKSVAARASSSKLKSKKPNVAEKKTFSRKTPSSLKNSQTNSAKTTAAAANPERQQMIQYAAYHIAEKDGFQSGKEQEYWLLAEQQIAGLFGNIPQKDNSH